MTFASSNPLDLASYDQAFCQGVWAHEHDQPASSNPYPAQGLAALAQAMAWLDGWQAASEDRVPGRKRKLLDCNYEGL